MLKESNEIIRALREDADLKQMEIARVIGTTQQQYSRYEKARYEIPSRVFRALADYYGVSVDYLMGRTESARGVCALNEAVTPDCTSGALLTDVLALGAEGRAAVVAFVRFQKNRA